MFTPETILDRFKRDAWKSEPFDAMLTLAKTTPSEVTRLIKLALDRQFQGETFLQDAVSYVPESELSDLACYAVNAFIENGSDLPQNIIAHLSLQAVETLQPFLSGLLSTNTPNDQNYDSEWIWRGASDHDVERQIEELRVATSSEASHRLFQRIAQSRNSRFLSQGCAAVANIKLRNKPSDYLLEVGFDGPDRRLYSSAAYHLRLPPDIEQLSPRRKFSHLQPHHPTWHLQAQPGRHRLGGYVQAVCPVCSGRLHNLLTLDPVPEGLSFKTPCLQLITCLSCLGWSTSPLFYKHTADGTASPMYAEPKKPEFPATALMEAWVELCATPKRWQWQDWGISNSRQNLHRIGGHPTWIQGAEFPNCPLCLSAMAMILQLDSDLLTEDGHEWMWGSGGICYVFWCQECRVSASLWQCT